MDRRWRASFQFSLDDQPASRRDLECAVERILDRFDRPFEGHVQLHIDVYSVVGEVPHEFTQQEAQCYDRLGLREQSRLVYPFAPKFPGNRVRPRSSYL